MIRTLALIALAVIATPTAASAEPGEKVVVTISKTDLTSSRSALRRKIAGAIEEVCGSYAAVESYQWMAIDDCRRSAWADVQGQLADLMPKDPIKIGTR